MRHDIKKKKFFNISKKNRVITDCRLLLQQKIVNKGSCIRRQEVVYKHHENFSLTDLGNHMSLENDSLHRSLFL